jgi:hypothetical protein
VSVNTEKIALPVQYRDDQVLRCDGCGIVADNPLRVGPDIVGAYGWFTGGTRATGGGSSAGTIEETRVDFCPDCTPTIMTAHETAIADIKAAKVAVAAEAHGVPG